MENISSLNQTERVRFSYLLITGLIFLSIFTIAILGLKGLTLAIFGLIGLVITPFLYNKPKIFLFFALFIYPFTRILPLDDKLIITGALYALSMPCTFWIIKKYFNRIADTSIYLWTMLIFILVVLFNYFRPDTSIIELAKEFGRPFFAIFIVLAVYNYVESSPENLRKLTKYISILFNIIALVAIGQYITGIGGITNEGFYRIRGTFFNFNDYGYAISLFICLALYVLMTTEKHKLYWMGTLGLNLIALIGTFSKVAIINTMLIFLVMGMFLPWKRKIQLFGILTLIGTIVTTFLISTGALSILVSRFSDTSSLEWRFEMWRRLYNMIIQGNILIGQGITASKDFLAVLMPTGQSNAPHNIYLETAYDIGLIGVIPFILTFIFILFQGISIFAKKGIINNYNKLIGASIIVIASITMIQNFASNAFYDRAGNIIFWAILSLLVCWYKYYREQSTN